VRKGIGSPLSNTVRRRIEPVLGADLSHVRVHAGADAREAAAALRARAFTAGADIWLGAGESAEDLGLMAHEAAHVAQRGSPEATAAPTVIRRAPLDPGNVKAWDWLDTHRSSTTFQETLHEAPKAAQKAEESITKAGVPRTDEEKSQFAARAEGLVRLNALRLMASHRASVAKKRDELFATADGATKPSSGGGALAPDSVTKNAAAIRAAAQQAVKLSALKEELDDYRGEALLGSTAMLRGDSAVEAAEVIYKASSKHKGQAMTDYAAGLSEGIAGRDRIPKGQAVTMMFNWGRFVAATRAKQMGGVDIALLYVYNAFPLFGELKPKNVPGAEEESDEKLMARVKKSYDDLLDNIDGAIAKIGSGSIHPFDLPQALEFTRSTLSPELGTALKEAVKDREVNAFWIGVGLAFALAIVPVVGAALLAGVIGGGTALAVGAGAAALTVSAGVGVAQLVADVDKAVDRMQLAKASTSPTGEALGVAGPRWYEWAMLAVQAALTFADLRAAAHAINSTRPRFDVPPEAPSGAGQPPPRKPGAAEPGGAGGEKPGGGPQDPRAPAGGALPEAPPRDPRVNTTRNLENLSLTPGDAHAELRHIADNPGIISGQSPSRRARMGQHEWVEGPNGIWCRHSAGDLCTKLPKELEQVLGSGPTTKGMHVEEPPAFPERGRLPQGTSIQPGQQFGEARGGFWGGRPGHSEWFPDTPAAIQLTGNKPIMFRNGHPDFRPFAAERVWVPGISGTHGDFPAANRALAAKRAAAGDTSWLHNGQPNAAKAHRWMKKEGEFATREGPVYTWHHVGGSNDLLAVPTGLHEAVPHIGSASEARRATAVAAGTPTPSP
jgi:hypothetical protein